MKTDLFQSCGHCWVFQMCWHIVECSIFTASSFRIWSSSTGIPLALFVVMLSKAHLTLHSRMSGSRWVITPSWLVFSSVQFSCSVMSGSLQPYESQHARPPCPSPTPRVHSDSFPSSQWCHPAISSSVVPFCSCPQSLPASESFPMRSFPMSLFTSHEVAKVLKFQL